MNYFNISFTGCADTEARCDNELKICGKTIAHVVYKNLNSVFTLVGKIRFECAPIKSKKISITSIPGRTSKPNS